MDYTVPFHREISGDAVPLKYIAEAMARKAATNFGTRRLHGPTLENTRTQYESSLLNAARNGSLTVCGRDGVAGSVDELVNAAEGIPDEWSNDVKAMLVLHVKCLHLNEWATTNGDVFHLIDVPADVLEYGPARPDGTKEYRGYAPWPFECFGEHGYFDTGQDGIPIELADDDFETDGFVKVAGAAAAVAKFLLSKGSPNRFQAERDAWPHILTGVMKGVLHPVSPTTLSPLSIEHCGNGMVLFSELVAWGQTTKLFAFRKAANAPVVEPAKVGAGDTATAEAIVRIKRAALIAKYEREWPAIEDDLRHSNENGLRQAAKIPNEHGYWNEPAVVRWGSEKGKLQVKQKLEAPNLDALTNWSLRQPT